MDPVTALAQRIVVAAQSIRSGEVDPLEFRLTESYRELQSLASRIDTRLDIDELLNEILTNKVTRIEELARVLGTPEVMVERVRNMSSRQLAGLIAYRQPVIISRLEPSFLDTSLRHLTSIIEAQLQPRPQERVPEMYGLPNDFRFETEDSVFIADLERFVKSIPRRKAIAMDSILSTDDFDEFLRRFLFIVILISKGMVSYDPANRSLIRV